jgi:hypothetical protein
VCFSCMSLSPTSVLVDTELIFTSFELIHECLNLTFFGMPKSKHLSLSLCRCLYYFHEVSV